MSYEAAYIGSACINEIMSYTQLKSKLQSNALDKLQPF